MNKRELNLEKYGISGKRYKELSGFCEQYPEWMSNLKRLKNPGESISFSGVRVQETQGKGRKEENEDRKEELESKCHIVENVARQASQDLQQYLIKSVCYEEPFWYLRDIMGIPCCQRTFYDYRRYFFYLLDREKKI
nr:hypothetical protein [uncultured Eisenbergiella sp.]